MCKKILPRRKNIRFQKWDYRNDGWYFVTIVVKNHRCIFGEIFNGKCILNAIGKRVGQFWKEIPQHFKDVRLDEFVVMPNHIHGIIVIDRANECGIIFRHDERNNDNTCRDVACNVPTKNEFSNISPKSQSLSVIIRSFKSACTREIRKFSPEFQWQFRFHDHIIRNQESLEKIQNYIHFNAEKWEDDDEHPKNFV